MNDFDADTLSFTSFDAAPARLVIRPQAVVENWQRMQARSGKARASAVVKADAYGLGAEDIVPALYEAGCRDFFVAVPDEGMLARQAAPEARIFVLSGVWPGTEEQFFNYDLVPVLASEDQIACWTNAVSQAGDHPCALMVDTGMNRLGLTVDEAAELANDPTRPASFSPVLVMSHLACADRPDHPLNRQQLESFQRVATEFEGIESSLSNSAGTALGADYHFDLTRPGIALYGGAGREDIPPGRAAVTAEARIVQLRNIKAGECVSYGATFTAERDTRLAVVAAGYADGIHRSLSGAGVPLRQAVPQGAVGFINGHRVPVAGRITMDLTIFDVTDAPHTEIRVGDYIELFGENVLLDEAARAAGTISYELLTSLGNRYQRAYV